MILGIAGAAGSGKTTVANVLAERGWAVVSLADPMKRICQDVFGWSHDRLWGPSECRNTPDPRWEGLTARHALQTLGTEWGRAMHPDVWVRMAIREARDHRRTVVPDVRFQNELDAIRDAGGRMLRVERPGMVALTGAAAAHASEAGALTGVSCTIVNDGTLDQLHARVLAALQGWA